MTPYSRRLYQTGTLPKKVIVVASLTMLSLSHPILFCRKEVMPNARKAKSSRKQTRSDTPGVASGKNTHPRLSKVRVDRPGRCCVLSWSAIFLSPLRCRLTRRFEVPTRKRVSAQRGPLKTFILRCSVGCFIAVMLLVALEKIMGIRPAPPMPFGFTVLAVVGIIWGMQKDKPKGE